MFYKTSIRYYHVLAVPIKESHTGEAMFEFVKQILFSVICDSWSSKLLSVAKDGVQIMLCRLQGTVTRLEQVSLPELFRIWCMVHKFDLVILSLMKNYLHENFINQ